MSDFGIALLDNGRGRAYLQILLNNSIIPASIFVMTNESMEEQRIRANTNIEESKFDKDFFRVNESVFYTLSKAKLNYISVDTVNINDPQLKECILKNIKNNIKYLIYCGGGILRNDVLDMNGVKWLHCHPGITPKYRGSTCFYYSIIEEHMTGVTCFEMDAGIDTGCVVNQKVFEPPFKSADYDNVYDSYCRSVCLYETVNSHINTKSFPMRINQDPNAGETYFVIHAVLKSLAIYKACEFKWPEISEKYNQSLYVYTTENRIEKPHKYSFAFYGPKLIDAYKQQRSSFATNLEEFQLNDKLDEILFELCNKLNESSTSARLYKLYQMQNIEELMKSIDKWVKKFEVWKRLYDGYTMDANFSKCNNNRNNILNYILLALCMFKIRKNHFQETLKYLNCGLKLIDTICSVPHLYENESSHKQLISYLLSEEEKIVTDLFDNKR